MTEPTTEAGQALVDAYVNEPYGPTAAQVVAIEAEARRKVLHELLRECEDARNVGFRRFDKRELEAWNYVVDSFERWARHRLLATPPAGEQ